MPGLVLFKLVCSGPRAICGQSESRLKVLVQLVVLSASIEVDGRSWSNGKSKALRAF